MMAFDFKKAYKELYMPGSRPVILRVPAMHYAAVRGKGDPNEIDGAYQQAISILYGISYTLKMSYRRGHEIAGFFDYVVPPLEGFWQQEGTDGVDYGNKAAFTWISVIRLPDFIKPEDFAWAVDEVSRKKKLDCSAAEFLTIREGLCVQMLHTGPFDSEPETVAVMDRHLLENGFENDFSALRQHHEIYLSDTRKTAPEAWRTVIRHPIKKRGF